MSNTSYLAQAQAKLKAVQGKKLSTDERKEAAIELATLLIQETNRTQTAKERHLYNKLGSMMSDPNGKAFTLAVTDQCFRSNRPARIANQLNYLIDKFGIPNFLPFSKQAQLAAFKWWGNAMPQVLTPLVKRALRKETAHVILPGELSKLHAHIRKRHREGNRVNLNHIGEAILGEEEAKRRLNTYLEDLADPEVEYVSIKISTIYSQINLLAWEDTVEILKDRLRQLYRAVRDNLYTTPEGRIIPKFVNLDMEEYRDVELTVAVFCKVLDEPEFHHFSAGIVLQSYLPDSYQIQQKLTAWAMERYKRGRAPIKMRLVKGANLAMEKLEASIREWRQTPYTEKLEVDANFKRMLEYGCQPEHASAVRLGIASHNLFDIAYAMLLREELQLQPFISFEMLEGMADSMCRVIQQLTGEMVLYCPAAKKEEFHYAIAYLVRRLDENTTPGNFLRHAFQLTSESEEWQEQARLFSTSFALIEHLSSQPCRTQNRTLPQEKQEPHLSFSNEPDTDWTLFDNRKWAEKILSKSSKIEYEQVPLVVAGEKILDTPEIRSSIDPSQPNKKLYSYAVAERQQIEKALEAAKKTEETWGKSPISDRSNLLAEVAHQFRLRRANLIEAMIADTGKIITEADVEVSEAIDFAEYYRHAITELTTLEDIQWKPKGTVLVASPWNFPCAIPTGGIVSALAAGNCVLFKPAPEAILVGWEVAKTFWEAGVSQDVLQFIVCDDEPTGSELVQDPRISSVILTGGTATAKHLLKLCPGIDLMAETGGKNAIIVTGMADRDLAIKDILQSAFGHAGQKCSACSLAILEAEVYDDPHFMRQLKDAAASLAVGSAWNPATQVNPLIRPPEGVLKQGLTSLEEGEEWLLEPKQNPSNPYLWSPGIKLGVKPGSFMHQTELFGPALGVIRADNLEHAIKIANSTPYGLTSGLHSLDEREKYSWIDHIEAGNCYINRGITGAIVRRQPFGGYKESSFGRGAKAGGPNYLTQLMIPAQIELPHHKDPLTYFVSLVNLYVENRLRPEQLRLWRTSIRSYAFYWNHYFIKDHDPSQIRGQHNILRYVELPLVTLRIQEQDKEIDVMRAITAALTCGTPLDISWDTSHFETTARAEWWKLIPNVRIIHESEETFIARTQQNDIGKVRLLSSPSSALQECLANKGCNTLQTPVMANGRLELLNYIREVSLSIDYHRYGNIDD